MNESTSNEYDGRYYLSLMRRHATLNKENRLNSIHQRKRVRKKRKGQKDGEKEKDRRTF